MRNRQAATALMIIVGVILPGVFAEVCTAQTGFHRGQFVIWPSGAVAFPAGRFGEEDLDTSSLKIGHQTGYLGALDLGYVLSENAVAGLAFSYGRFDFDLTPEILEVYRERGFVVDAGRTSTIQVHAWLRYFLREPFAHWRPYVVVGVGVGRPTGTVEYAEPTEIQGLDGLYTDSELRVDLSVSMTGGVGALIPVSSGLALGIEPRYCRISTKGTTRTDVHTREDGTTVEAKYGKEDGEEFRLKSKSNTDWWEIRIAVVFILR